MLKSERNETNHKFPKFFKMPTASAIQMPYSFMPLGELDVKTLGL